MAGTLGTITGQVRLDVKQAVAAYAALRGQHQKTMYALRGTGDAFIRSGRGMMLGGLAIAYGFGKAVSAAAEFERKMDYFGAVTDTNSRKMEKLSKFTLQVAQDTIYSANEIADGFVELGKAGVNADQIIRGVGRAMAYLGAAGDIPLPESAQIITSAVAQFDLGAKDAIHVADLLAGAANASIADITDIGYSLKYVGGIAHVAGLGLDDVTTAISILAKAGIRGSTAGTTLRQMIVSLPGVTDKAQAELKKLGIITKDGTNLFYDQAGSLKPLSKVYQILQDHTENLTAKQKTQALRTIFQTRALSSAAVLTRAGAKGFKNMYGEMSKVTAMEVANKRLDNLSGDIEILRGNIETLVIQQGGPFQETLRKWVQGLTKLVQAYSNLDPKTQRMISQTLLFSSAALILLGALNLVIGIILKFIYNMIRMAEATAFLFRIIKSGLKVFAIWGDVWAAIQLGVEAVALALGLTVGAFLAIVAAVVAAIAVFVILYKKWGAFHDLVNRVAGALWNVVKAIGNFFKTLVTNPGKILDSLKSGFDSLKKWASQIPGWLGNAFKTALGAVGNFIMGIVHWFISLPGKVWGAITGFFNRLKQLFTLKNIGYALGYALGLMVRYFIIFGIKAALAVATLIGKVVGFFRSLPGKIASFVVKMAARVYKSFQSMKARAIAAAARLVMGVVHWMQTLPGRVAGFVVKMAGKAIGSMINFAKNLPKYAKQAKDGIINWLKDLPTKGAELILKMVDKGKHFVERLPMIFFNAGLDLYNKFQSAVANLPSVISNVLGNMISTIKSKISEAFNSVKDFASSMWNGFKAGLGIHSPSYMEKAMWQITGVMDKETKRLAGQTLKVQQMSKKLAKTPLTVGDPSTLSAFDKYRELASMQAINLKASRTLAEGSGKQGLRDARRTDRKQGGPRSSTPFHIDNWHEGRGHFREIAQDAIDDDHDYEDALGRMY